jgi:hypothetical protein
MRPHLREAKRALTQVTAHSLHGKQENGCSKDWAATRWPTHQQPLVLHLPLASSSAAEILRQLDEPLGHAHREYHDVQRSLQGQVAWWDTLLTQSSNEGHTLYTVKVLIGVSAQNRRARWSGRIRWPAHVYRY